MHRVPKGCTIVLHRQFTPTIFPSAEGGPAAIVCPNSTSWASPALFAKSLEQGNTGPRDQYSNVEWLGARRGVYQKVEILSPKAVEPHRLEVDRIQAAWHDWRTDFAPAFDTDVVILWQPKKIFPRKTLRQIAVHLLEQIFEAGAVYESWELHALAREAIEHRKQRQQ